MKGKANMIVSKAFTIALAGALLSGVGGSVAFAQQPTGGTAGQTAGDWGQPGSTFAMHSNAVDDCPAMDWNIVVQKDGIMTGMVGVDDTKAIFRLTGTYSGANFHLNGQEVGGTRTASANGQLQEQKIAMTLGGLPVGSRCQGKTVYIQRREPAQFGGGG
jgi:hypothetical protein